MNKIKDAQAILLNLGMPTAQCNEISALTFLALCGIKNTTNWEKATRKSLTVTKGVMSFIAENYKKEYAPNTRETFRRQVLHQFVQGGIADYNPDNPNLPTNSPHAHYAVTQAALKVAKAFETDNFKTEVQAFIKNQGTLLEIYQKKRYKTKVPVTLPDGHKIELSPGKHNKLQALIVKDFAARFLKKPVVLYLGDTAKKNLHIEYEHFAELGIKITEHDKLPDVVILDSKTKWLFLIEAVTSHGPMTPKRVVELEEMFKNYSQGLIFVSAFLDFAEFKRHSKDIAWETEVWIANFPEHMIHYNGDKFFGPK
ncbi:MAG: restriction endonuclease [Spirochaetales bacterium]|nr:restriction endonuclease [Spirochaetales bacterium]